jgi:cell division protein FtsB
MVKTGWTRVGAVVLLTLGLIYVVKLTDLGLETHSATLASQRMEAEVAVLELQVEAMETAAVDAKTDAYVEMVARDTLKMVREGDQPFVTVNALTSPEAAPPAQVEEPSVWQRFLRWMRGDEIGTEADAPAPASTAATDGSDAPATAGP